MPSEDTKILLFNQYQKSNKALFIIYADLECVIEKIGESENILENSSTTKVSKLIQSGFPMSTIFSFRSVENKYDLYRGKYCMIKFCESLREHEIKKILKTKNEVINKRAAGIAWKCKNLLFL